MNSIYVVYSSSAALINSGNYFSTFHSNGHNRFDHDKFFSYRCKNKKEFKKLIKLAREQILLHEVLEL